MQHHSSYTHNFFSTSCYPNSPPVEEQPLADDHSGGHVQVQPTFDTSDFYNFLSQFGHFPNDLWDTAIPTGPHSSAQDATAGGSTSYGGANQPQPSQLYASSTQRWGTTFVEPTFDGSYSGAAAVSAPPLPAVQIPPQAAMPFPASNDMFNMPNATAYAAHQAPAVMPLVHATPGYNVAESQLPPTPSLTFSINMTPSPLNGFLPYDGGVSSYAAALPSASFTNGAPASQWGQFDFAQRPVHAVSQREMGPGGAGQSVLDLGFDDTALQFDGRDLGSLLPQQPVAGPSTARADDDLVDPRWLQHDGRLALTTTTTSGPTLQAPSGPTESAVPPTETETHHASGSSVSGNASQPPACGPSSSTSPSTSHTMKGKTPERQPRKSGRRAVPDALGRAGLKRGVQEASAARTPAKSIHIFQKAGRAARVPVTHASEIHVELLPEALYVQSSHGSDPLPQLEDLDAIVTAGILPQVALPSPTTIREGSKTTSLTPRQTIFAVTDTWTSDGKLERPLKCKECPGDPTLKDWVNFKRHCAADSSHPSQLYFCKRCWKPFARVESCVRHVNSGARKGVCPRLSEKGGKDRLGQEMRWLIMYEAYMVPRVISGAPVEVGPYHKWAKEQRKRLLDQGLGVYEKEVDDQPSPGPSDE
ncbi:hypothetical protein BC834DRAFT_973665 [Gloeopeniophorella convolvens]|nr:hypothetical protein BC834DRAFT_973665 [Gloeopeniophorella convolvens]